MLDMPKNALFLLKNHLAQGAPPPRPLSLTAGGPATISSRGGGGGPPPLPPTILNKLFKLILLGAFALF